MRFTQMPAKLQKATLLFSFGFLFLCYPVFAQQNESITPLHKFFQANYDSTIIHYNWSNWYSAPNYLILAKQKNNIYFFTYTSPYKNVIGRPIPGNLSKKFAIEENRFKATVPDTNRYLLAKRVLNDKLKNYWNELHMASLWNIKDDKHTLRDIGNCMIEDAGTATFYFISKTGIKVSNFYAPDFWEECLGKDINRQKALKAEAILWRIVKEE